LNQYSEAGTVMATMDDSAKTAHPAAANPKALSDIRAAGHTRSWSPHWPQPLLSLPFAHDAVSTPNRIHARKPHPARVSRDTAPVPYLRYPRTRPSSTPSTKAGQELSHE